MLKGVYIHTRCHQLYVRVLQTSSVQTVHELTAEPGRYWLESDGRAGEL